MEEVGDCMLGVEIRLVTVPIDTDIAPFVPTIHDIESGVIKTIEEKAQEVLAAGAHRLLALKAPVPHHPTDMHMIYWVDRASGNGKVHPWEDDEWAQVANDHQFLEQVQSFVKNFQERDPKLRCYFFIGFVPSDADVDPVYAYPRGMQSQARMHIH